MQSLTTDTETENRTQSVRAHTRPFVSLPSAVGWLCLNARGKSWAGVLKRLGLRWMRPRSTDTETNERTHSVRAHTRPSVSFPSAVGRLVTQVRRPRTIALLACLAVCILLGSAGGDALSSAGAGAPASATACPPLPTLLSQRVAQAPLLDGVVDAVWSEAVTLAVPLTWGRHGQEQALVVQLQSLHTDEAVYFLAQWPDPQPATEPGVLRNRLTLHFDFPAATPDAAEHMCLVACHTAFADADGHLAYLSAETIPPGRTSPLPAAGGWEAGSWRLEWSRPLLVDNGYDVQFDDLQLAYPFFVKVFQWQEGRADPVSADCQLVFQR
jgi:ribosomal protein S19